MSGPGWWLVSLMSRSLRSDERDAVLGDFAEAGEAEGRALAGVLGLVARRQAALWRHWRAWVVLVSLVIPLGLLLCFISDRTADTSAIYIWMYANNLDWNLFGNPSFVHDLAHYAGTVAFQLLALFCVAWGGGFVIGSAARGSVMVQGILFVLVAGFGRLAGAMWFYTGRHFSNNAVVFGLPFYRDIFPMLVLVCLVLIPAVLGMCQAQTEEKTI